jgi:3-hydroxyacyl-CoA dehydrogenase
MLARRTAQAELLLLEGATPAQVDDALVEFGFPMGPFALADLAGLDVGWRSRMDRGVRAEIADTLCEMGRFGQKAGKGYYRYEGRTRISDPEVDEIIGAIRGKLSRAPREISRQEIFERLIYPMINEGARILDEGIAARPGDIDTIWLNGYAWPIQRGGPMYFADQVGLDVIADRLTHYSKLVDDASVSPSPLLASLSSARGKFGSLAK